MQEAIVDVVHAHDRRGRPRSLQVRSVEMRLGQVSIARTSCGLRAAIAVANAIDAIRLSLRPGRPAASAPLPD
jgi:hypothetical protein